MKSPNWRELCANPHVSCGHPKGAHGERGDCQVGSCLCAAWVGKLERCECGHHAKSHCLVAAEAMCKLCPCLNFSHAIKIARDEEVAEEEPSKVVQKWADTAMFTSEPLDAHEGPKVYLLSMNTDPLGSVAAACKMYKGEVVRDLSEVTDEERRYYLAELQKTKLTTPLEAVNFHFLLEGVTRSFTHQLVRQRTAAYAQESLRFAVVEDGFEDRVALPPSLSGVSLVGTGYEKWVRGEGARPGDYDFDRLTDDQKNLVDWLVAVKAIEAAYTSAVNRGMPAEDARGLLPHNITTRVHYTTNLRSLLDHAGNRLCTQAQFEWRLVWARMVEAIRNYDPRKANAVRLSGEDPERWSYRLPDRWQFEALANIFKPVCYQTGKCAFEADFDRKCSIRDRVQANASINRPSSEWGKMYTHDHMPRPGSKDPAAEWPWAQKMKQTGDGFTLSKPVIPPIQPAEWLLDPGAAR